MSRRVVIPRFGIGGRNTDKPTWALDPSELQDGSQDGVIWEGAMRRRMGFRASAVGDYGSLFGLGPTALTRVYSQLTNTAATAFAAWNLSPLGRYQDFGLQYAPRQVLYTSAGGGVASSPGRSRFADYLPRAVYRGEILWCAQDGLGPLTRQGVINRQAGLVTSNFGNWAAGQARIVALTSPSAFAVGSYMGITGNGGPPSYYAFIRVVAPDTDTASSTVTLENIRTSGTNNVDCSNYPCGLTYPAVAVYSVGTVSCSGGSSTINGEGTRWWSEVRRETAVTSAIDIARPSSIMVLDPTGSVWRMVQVINYTSETTLSSLYAFAASTGVRYNLTSNCPFKDVCIHNETLYGVGVAQFPSRVYIAPPGWDLSSPPGATLPWDPSVDFTSASAGDLLLDFVDVPVADDGDPIIAILETDGPRLVVKVKSIWGLYGEPPNITPRLLHSGDGGIDINACQSTPNGAFIAGTDGIYHYRNQSFEELTVGWMQNEWRALTNSGIESCAIEVDGDRVIVAVTTITPSQRRTYIYDMRYRRWLPEMSNVCPNYMVSTANMAAEIPKILAVDPNYSGLVLNLRPALDLSGPARDEVGVGPDLTLITGDGLTQSLGIEGEVRVLDAVIHATLLDADNTTQCTVKVLHGGSLAGAEAGEAPYYDTVNYDSGYFYGEYGCASLGAILTSTGNDAPTRVEAAVNRTGRRVAMRIDESTASSTVQSVEIGEVILTMKDMRSDS